MRKSYYLPQKESDQVTWLKNFSKGLIALKGKGIIDDTVIDDMVKKVEKIIYDIDKTERAKQVLQNQVAEKNILKKATFKDVRNTVQLIKLSDNYSEGIGKDLDITGTDDDFDPHTYQPELHAENTIKGVEIKFTKSQTDGINLYRKNGDEKWTYLSRDSRSPYIDTENFNQPTKVQYKAVAVLDDEEIGKESDIITILTD
jgi:hypothetical protein